MEHHVNCWNCLRTVAQRDYTCPNCGQATKPNLMQATVAKSRLQYLLDESQGWSFLPEEVRRELSQVYRSRAARLEAVERGIDPYWPETDWTSPFLLQQWSLDSPPLRPDVASVTEKLDLVTPTPDPDVEAVGENLNFTAPAARVTSPPLHSPLSEAPSESAKSSTIAERAASARLALSARQDQQERSHSQDDPALVHLPLRPHQQETPLAPIPLPTPEEETVAAKILAEADIRWFHSLGALLVVAAVVGWLRATWDGYGKNLAGFLILCSPLALHAVAHQMKKSVPLSARLLAILAGVLTAPALLAVEIFDFLPPGISGQDYWTFALLVSGTLLGWQAHASKETVPLYVGALCTVMAGWSQGALVTSVLCLLLGFVLAPVKADSEAGLEQREWAGHLQKVGFAAGVFGCFSTLFLFRPERSPLVPLLAFSGALIYLHLPTLTRQSERGGQGRVALQAGVTVLGMFLMRGFLDIPAGAVGLYSLLAAGLFLSARPQDEGGLMALRLGSILGFIGLALGFFFQGHLLPGELGQGLAESTMRFLLAIAGTGLFGYLSRQPHLESQRDALGLSALFSMFGGWYHLFLSFCAPIDGSYFRENGQIAPLLASMGLLVAVWLVASRWLQPRERDLVSSVSAPLLVLTVGAVAAFGLASSLQTLVWGRVMGWLALVSLLWDRQLLAPWNSSEPENGSEESSAMAQSLGLLLPRLVLWSTALAWAFSGTATTQTVALAAQAMGFLFLLGPAKSYRQPGLEIAWVLTPVSLALLWSEQPYPQHFLVLFLLYAVSWAAGPLRPASFILSVAASSVVGLATLESASHASLLALPLAYGLFLMLPPAPGQGTWQDPGPAKYGFDLLLNGCLFLPLSLAPQSFESLALTVSLPILAILIGRLAGQNLSGRLLSPFSAHLLLASGFIWTLAQGPQESGLLLLLASGWAFTLKSPPAPGVEGWDLANGLAILGGAWLLAESHLTPSIGVIALSLLVSECIALVETRWRPNISNLLFLILMVVLTSRPDCTELETGLAVLAGLLAAIRGLTTVQMPLVAAGLVLFLKATDGQLSLLDADFKLRLLPLAAVLIATSLWLCFRPLHPAGQLLGVSPLAGLRLGIALIALPPLCGLAIGTDMAENFVWVLVTGCSTLALSFGFLEHPDLSDHLKKSGGWILTGWALVSLGRVAMQLPWQLATLVVGLLLVGAGVMAEKRRKL